MMYPSTTPDTDPPPPSIIPLTDSSRSSVRALFDSVDAANTAKETERMRRVRAAALRLAVDTRGFARDDEILTLADRFATYINDGVRPDEPA